MGLRVLTSAALAVALVLPSCADVPVIQGVGEVEANRALVALDHGGIAARKQQDEASGADVTWRVTVADNEVAHAVSVLSAAEIPRRDQAGFAETFGTRSLVSGAAEERARAAQAVAGELARTLATLDGVVAARVHVALPGPPELGTDTAPARPTASVLVTYATPTPGYDEAAVRRLVAGAVEAMHPEDVTVVGTRRPAITAPPVLAWVGSFAVARGSAQALRGTLVVLAGTVVALFAALGFSVWRHRR